MPTPVPASQVLLAQARARVCVSSPGAFLCPGRVAVETHVAARLRTVCPLVENARQRHVPAPEGGMPSVQITLWASVRAAGHF